MSKLDGLRAMREAKYEASRAGASPRVQPRPVEPAPKAAPEVAAAAPGTAPDGLCGHRSMNGRTCTREHGHSARSHRYS